MALWFSVFHLIHSMSHNALGSPWKTFGTETAWFNISPPLQRARCWPHLGLLSYLSCSNTKKPPICYGFLQIRDQGISAQGGYGRDGNIWEGIEVLCNCWGAGTYLEEERTLLLLPDSRLVSIQLSSLGPQLTHFCTTLYRILVATATSFCPFLSGCLFLRRSKKHFLGLASNALADLKHQQPRSLNYYKFCQGERWRVLSVNFLLWDATFVSIICRFSFPEQSAFISTTGTSLTSWKVESYPYPIAACFHR